MVSLWYVILQYSIGTLTILTSILFHELGHRKFAWEHDKNAQLVWTKRGPGVEYTSTTPRQERRILLAGIFMGLPPIYILALFGEHIHTLTMIGVVVLYLLLCKTDFKRLYKIENKVNTE